MNTKEPAAGPSTTLPEDRDIPALASAAEEGLDSVLARVGIRTAGTHARVAKHHPGERCTLLVEGGREPLVVKCYSHDPTPEAEMLEVLRAKGLASGRAPTAAPLVACEPALSVLVTRSLPGPSAWDLVRNGAGERAGMLAAAWLRRALEARLEVGEHHGVDYVLGHARSRARMIGRVDPALGTAAGDVADALEASPPAETGRAFLHGSFYANHVLDSGGGPGIIDWDRFRQGPIEFDVAMFLATLSRLATLKPELAPHTQAAARALTTGMSEFIDAQALAWQQAAALLTLAKRVVWRRRQRWRQRAGALISEAGELASASGSRPSTSGSRSGKRLAEREK
jgi:hypothetical protein